MNVCPVPRFWQKNVPESKSVLQGFVAAKFFKEYGRRATGDKTVLVSHFFLEEAFKALN
jgi:hypothetical protein